MNNKTIGVFFGSRSPEHDVSIITAQLIIDGLKKIGYPVVPVYLSKTGDWYIDEALGSLKFFSADPDHLKLSELDSYSIDLEQSNGKLVFTKKGLLKKSLTVDIAFPAFHGANGEDGTVQGLFEIFNIPYVGCDVPSSAIAMDKVLTKQFYQSQQIPTTKFVFFHRSDWLVNQESVLEKIKNTLSWPVFVKPAHLGSSIGMSKASSEKDLQTALEVAFHYDLKVVVEESVEALGDITCAVMGHKIITPSLLQESVFQAEFFDYTEKYLNDGGAQLGNAQDNIVIPARLDDETTKHIQDQAVAIYRLIGCSGIARVDFLYDKNAKIAYANEINPLPGTLYHHLWKKSGVELPELLARLIEAAVERQEEKSQLTQTFQSEILRQANSQKLQLKGGKE